MLKQQNNNIEELFKDKLHNLEADPGANAWANVQAGISASAASGVTTASASSWASSVIVGIIITAVAIGGFFLFNNEGEKKVNQKEEPAEVTTITSEELLTNITEEVVESETPELSNLNDIEKKKVKENTSESTKPSDLQTASTKKVEMKEEVELDSSEPIVYEKTIDEILAEHQQFIEKQAGNSSQTEADQSEIKSASKIVQTEKEVSSNSKSNINQQTDLENKQKQIAEQVVFPNIFSPDLDGHNDVFKMTVEKSIPIDNIQVSVLDLKGKVIGAFTGIYEGWDGRLLNGNFAPSGWYTYQAIIYVDGKQISKVGGFSLTR
ncbi:MAG: gliding motility-associated-like protein [Vicingaceae bacterium]